MSEENTTLKPAVRLTLNTALRDWMPSEDHNGNPPSPQQKDIISYCIEMIHAGHPLSTVIEAVAGSGKTTLLRMLFGVLAKAFDAGFEMSVTATQFNSSGSGALVAAMNESKPDGADWTSGGGTGTMNSHGKKSLQAFFEHPLVITNDRYTALARIVACDMLADPVLRADYEANIPLTKAGNKREMWSWYALRRFISAVTTKAMTQGFFAPVGSTPTAEEWTGFMRSNAGSFRVDEHPIGQQILAQLPVLVGRVIDLGMFLIENEGEVAQCSPNALMGVATDYGRCDLIPASQFTDAELTDRFGVRVEPLTTRQSSGYKVIPYRSKNFRSGQFTDKRLEVVFPANKFNEMRAVKNQCWDNKDSFGMFGYANDGPNTKAGYDKRSEAHFQSSEWVLSIKDDNKAIDAFTACAERAGLPVGDAFHAEAQTDSDNGGYAARIAHIDCIYAVAYFNVPAWRQFDLMFVDEVQDMSPLQHDLLNRLTKGSVVLVGDRRQSLYLFAGSKSDSMDYGAGLYDCTPFPMTVCWRQTTALADEVSMLIGSMDGQRTKYADHVSPIALVPTWPQGSSSTVHHVRDLTRSVEVGHMVLCRISAPLVSYAIATLKNGIPARLAGGGDLESSVRNMWRGKVGMCMDKQSFTARHQAGDDYLATVLQKQTAKAKGDAVAAGNSEEYRTACDMVEATLALADRYTTTTSTPTVDGFADGDKKHDDFIAGMFVDPNDTGENYVLFSTVHRAKGLERKTVHIITDRMTIDNEGKERISPCFMLPWSMSNEAEIDQELNAVYVCITRAMDTQRYYTNNVTVSTGEVGDIQQAMWMLNQQDEDKGISINMGQWPVTNDEDDDDSDYDFEYEGEDTEGDESTDTCPADVIPPTMPQFALIADEKVYALTNDQTLAMEFLIDGVNDEDFDISEYDAGTVITSPFGGDYSVWVTSLPLTDDITQIITKHWDECVKTGMAQLM
mgnify:CR=1 FL=1